MYAQACTRPYISSTVSVIGMFQSNLGMEHWKVAKYTMRHLQLTKDSMLVQSGSDVLEIVGYIDSDFANSLDDMKST